MTCSKASGDSASCVIGVTVATTVLVTLASYALPDEYAATGVAFGFLAAVYWRVLRRDATDVNLVRRYGLALGGVLERGSLDVRRLLRDTVVAIAWAFGLGLLIFPAFWLGFKLWWQPVQSLQWVPPSSYLDELLGQLLVIALPEEAFYRGYLQTSLDNLDEARCARAERPRRTINVFGAQIGWAVPVSSAVFAVGHFLTQANPERLAVFFPSLVFGWLRQRTGGIGAAVLFHALSNIVSATLGRGYGLY